MSEKYYPRVSAPKTQCPGATSAPCTCELQRKPHPSRKRNRRSDAAAIFSSPWFRWFCFDSVRFAKRVLGDRQTLKSREERPPSNWGEAISNPARIHRIPSFVIADQVEWKVTETGQQLPCHAACRFPACAASAHLPPPPADAVNSPVLGRKALVCWIPNLTSPTRGLAGWLSDRAACARTYRGGCKECR
jgi:hypothetical protein